MPSVALYRRKLKIPFVQVIGSAGKTTTKEMIGSVLRQKLNPMVGWKNDNLPAGVARNIFRVKKSNRAAVVEAAMLRPGQIRTSTRMIRPAIGVVTSIQRVHLMRLGSMKKIISVKGEMLEEMSQNSTLIMNGADANCKKLPLHKFKGKVLRYGFSKNQDLWASGIKRAGFKTSFTAIGKGFRMKCRINTFGKYNVGNALAAVLVGKQLGLTRNQIARGLVKFQPPERRLKIHKGRNGTIIINDNFNANPDSTRLLLDELAPIARKRPVVLVLGDIENPSNRIRKYARKVHFTIGQQIAGIPFKHVLVIGKWAREYVRGACSAGLPKSRIEYFPTVDAARPSFRKLLVPGTVVVLKASVYTPIRKLI
ncbi:MAG: UDP-N-acetylmuramoyl-tripeptide--D-alanyl-D-alanine ligase [Syntrophomonas sp.]|nr:UDP-N-acetylmuramoyl-tripeptide--D-alanyl-D-alanine ligase [Syntrophomonas sp.]